MKSSVLFILLSFVGALSLSAQGIGSGPMSMIDGTGQLGVVGSPGVSSNDQSLIIPIPDCGPCEPGDDPWTEDVIPLPPMPKAPGLPKCYPNCLTETVVGSALSSSEESLIIPIPDCGPCEPGDDPWEEDVIPLPPMPKAPGLPKCYPNCLTEAVAASALSPSEESLIIPIPDCGPCEPGDDPWEEDVIPLPPMPKAPGLPKCYPNCVAEGVDSPQFQSLGLMSWTAPLPFGVRPEARLVVTRVRATA
jgi:hypothetical protein